ncbi:DUF4352 domain-containing protein [Cytobacillus oceanisediminis]|uniref:DUF4352 domain-containing protein n=1 Tax=Cytobacillus oceanisediminis TaxID=665099 RepID=UPI00207A81CF|nr:DUF4352 domain-containing protein [Cytobacillus oceanisediminis]USK43569.1 DUF4352 domain-containing protein [Cytobacillus oceanisediminis]
MKKFFKMGCFGFIGLIVLSVIISLATGGDEEKATTEPKKEDQTESTSAKPKEKEEKKEEPKVSGLNEPTKVGDVVFTAAGTSTAASVGPEGFGQTAQGTYLIVDVAVKNESKEAITTDSTFFKLKVGDVEYEADATADIYANEAGGGFFLQKINPGLEFKGKIVFDVPADVVSSKDLLLNVQTGFFGTEQGQIKLAK